MEHPAFDLTARIVNSCITGTVKVATDNKFGVLRTGRDQGPQERKTAFFVYEALLPPGIE